jgi:curved DNA-binding protein CbpA
VSRPFVDFYEALQISPNADRGTIERVFRHLAKRYHPDNQHTGDDERFQQLLEAYRVLCDPEARASYDVGYQGNKEREQSLLGEALDLGQGDDDAMLRERLLSLLYVQRRRDVRQPTIGNVELERLLSCPQGTLDFHMWYLKEKGLVEHTDRGFAITVLGIDEAEASRTRLPRERLLAERATEGAGGAHADSTSFETRTNGGGRDTAS